MSDILVVGGGIAGLLTARELARAGARASLIEMGECGRESTWAGGGILSPLYPWRYPDALTTLVRASQTIYPHLCAELYEESGIDPELIASGLAILDTDELDQALDWAARQGTEIELADREHLHAAEPELARLPTRAMLMPHIQQVRNPRLAQAARRALLGRVQLHEHTEILEILTEGGRVCGVRTADRIMAADRVVVCAGAWTARLLAKLVRVPDIAPVRGQMILLGASPGQIRHMVLAGNRYAIPRSDGQVLIGSTLEYVGFDKSTTDEAREDLRQVAVDLFPCLAHTPLVAHWAGLRPGSPSGIPYIGEHPGVGGLFFNAGHFRNGLVAAPASARLAADLALGRPPQIDPAPYALDAPR